MIPLGYFHNVETLRRAARDGNVAFAVSKLLATGEPIVIVLAMEPRDDEVGAVPFGHFAPGFGLTPNGRLNDEAKAQHKVWVRALAKDDALLALAEDADEHVQLVRFGPRANSPLDPAIRLPWDNPYALYADPTADPAD